VLYDGRKCFHIKIENYPDKHLIMSKQGNIINNGNHQKIVECYVQRYYLIVH